MPDVVTDQTASVMTLTDASPEAAARPRLNNVVAIVDNGFSPFEFAVACEVFGIDRRDSGVPAFDFAVCSPHADAVPTQTGFAVLAPYRLERLASADLAIMPTIGVDYQPSPEMIDALRDVVARGGQVASLCAGAYALARTGLLDGRRATTHWRYCEDFARQFPQIEVVPDVLYVKDGQLATSAGTASGIDLCLSLVRDAHGSGVANAIARRMVVPPQRDGGQAQYVVSPVRDLECETLAPLLDWAAAHLDQDLSVAMLAKQAGMSERTFARRFRDETGTTPHAWLLDRRVALAQELLESGELGIEQVAQRCGFGSAAMLRHHFTRLRGTAPSRYRRTFCG